MCVHVCVSSATDQFKSHIVCGVEGAERLVITGGLSLYFSGPVSVWDLRQAKELITWPATGMVELFPDMGLLVLQPPSFDKLIVYTLATGAQRELPIATQIALARIWERRLYLVSAGTHMWCLDLDTYELIPSYLPPAKSWKMHGPIALCSNADGKLAIVHLATRQRLLEISNSATVGAAWLHSDCLYVLTHRTSGILKRESSLELIDLTEAKQRQRVLFKYEQGMVAVPKTFTLFPGLRAPIAMLSRELCAMPAPVVTTQP